jgi:hypothetical protein
MQRARLRLGPLAFFAGALLAGARSSSAQEAPAPPVADAAPPARRAVVVDVPRPWLYSADPAAPAAGHVVAGMGVGYAAVDKGVGRPFAADLAHAGAVFDVNAEVGLARFASIVGQGLMAGQGGGQVAAGAMLGVSLHPWPVKGGPVDVAVSGGYLRELGGANGAWGRVALAGDLGALRLTATALGQHVVQTGRDGVDLVMTTGASYALGSIVRLGAEYVVQDLEGAWEPNEAEGGVRHFLGPTLGVHLGRAQLGAGPAFGLSAASPRYLGRLAAAYSF